MRKVLLGAILAATATPIFAENISIETATGSATLPLNPEKIAVFDIPAIDTLNALGVNIDGAPEKLYVDYLEDVSADAEKIGTIFEPNFESLAIMAPDAIIIGSRSSEQAAPLSKIAPTIDMTISGEGIVEQAKARINAYGDLFGIADKATALTEELDAKIERAQEAVNGKGNALIILTNGTKISAYGGGSRFGWLHETVGLPFAADGLDAETHGMAISFEFIAEKDPDWLLVVDRGAAIGKTKGAAQATLDNPLIESTFAAQNGQIVYLDAAPLYISGGGAKSMMKTLDEVIAAFENKQG